MQVIVKFQNTKEKEKILKALVGGDPKKQK